MAHSVASSYRSRAPGSPEVGVIRAKLAPHRPPHGAVDRPLLLDRLRSGRARPLTLVSAPAGFGKSTLLSAWVQADGSERFAWVSLDGADREPARFWTHVVAALAERDGQVGARSSAALRSNPEHVVHTFLPVLLEELALGTGDLTLVLDDYHRAETAEINDQVAAFLQYRPARVQLVVATRSDPALGVARLRASGDLVELRADALRFDDVELSRFLSGVGVSGLSFDDEQRLARRTGGWPAPLRLAALLMPTDGRADFIDQFTGGSRHVVDYLTREVLDRLEPATRRFLLQVSVLDRLSGALCDAVVDGTGSGAILAELERANLFVSVDGTGEWFREHQLFSEALRVELARTEPALVPVLHARAAAWLEASGDVEGATEHAIVGRDVSGATRLITAQFPLLSRTGRRATVQRWLDALSWPDAVRDPELALVRALAASLDGGADDAARQVTVARSGRPDRVDADGVPLGLRTDVTEGLVGFNDLARAEAAARRAVESAVAGPWLGLALLGSGQAAYLQGRPADAIVPLRRVAGLLPDDLPILLAWAAGILSLAESALEVTAGADGALDRHEAALRASGAGRTAAAAVVVLARGEQDRRAGDLRSAIGWFDDAIDILAGPSRNAWAAQAYLLRAAAQRATGRMQAGLASLDLADEVLDRLPGPAGPAARSRALRTSLVVPAHHATEFGQVLSEREAVVLRLAADGLAQRQIADQLFISYNTVKSHLRAAYRKLGATSREDAVARLDLLTPPAVVEGAVRSPG